jgi:mycothiol S-conjugate amidase
MKPPSWTQPLSAREPLRLMAVHAHPDDESSKGGATMARYAAEGTRVLVVTLTGGERGSVLNKAMDRAGVRANIAAVRREEVAHATAILGVGHVFLGFLDSGLPTGDPPAPLPASCLALKPVKAVAAALVRVIRSFRPHVLITYDPSGGYPHPDHIMCHKVSVLAFEAAGDPRRLPGAGPAWQPFKLYYDANSSCHRLRALQAEADRRGLDSPFGAWLKDGIGRAAAPPVTTRISCGDYYHIRDRALLAHASQVDPNGFWFALPPAVQRAAWPTEDFHLARSLAGTELPEDDLFAGIPPATAHTAEVGRAAAAVRRSYVPSRPGSAVDLEKHWNGHVLSGHLKNGGC